jgi:hypothetical protein
MVNAKQEFLKLDELKGKDIALEFMGAQLKTTQYWRPHDWVVFNCSQYEAFLEWLDFNYNNGYGSQELHGFILLKNEKWLDRHVYDGSEHWVLRERPTLNPKINEER